MNFDPTKLTNLPAQLNEIRKQGVTKSSVEISTLFVAKDILHQLQEGQSIRTNAGLGRGRSAISDKSVAYQKTKDCGLNIAAQGLKFACRALEIIPGVGGPASTVVSAGVDMSKDWLGSKMDHITSATVCEANTLRDKAMQGLSEGNLPQVHNALIDLYGCLNDDSKKFTTEQKIHYLREIYPIFLCHLHSVEDGLDTLTQVAQTHHTDLEAIRGQTIANTNLLGEVVGSLNANKEFVSGLATKVTSLGASLLGMEDDMEKLESFVEDFVKTSHDALKEVNSMLVEFGKATQENSEICNLLLAGYLKIDISAYQRDSEIVSLHKAFQSVCEHGSRAEIIKGRQVLDSKIKEENERRERFNNSIALFNEAGNLLSLCARLGNKPEWERNIQVCCATFTKIAMGVAWHFKLGTLASTAGPLGFVMSSKLILEGMGELKAFLQGIPAPICDPILILNERLSRLENSFNHSLIKIDRALSFVFVELNFLRSEQRELSNRVQKLEQRVDSKFDRLQERQNGDAENQDRLFEHLSTVNDLKSLFERRMHDLVARLENRPSEEHTSEIFSYLSSFITCYPPSFSKPSLGENFLFNLISPESPYTSAISHINLLRVAFEKQFRVSIKPLHHINIWQIASILLATSYLNDKTNLKLSADSIQIHRTNVLRQALAEGWNLINFIEMIKQPGFIPTLFQNYRNSVLDLKYAAYKKIGKLERKYTTQCLSKIDSIRKEKIHNLTLPEFDHDICDEWFLEFTETDNTRGLIPFTFYSLLFPFGAAKDVVSLDFGHVSTRFTDSVIKTEQELLNENIFIVCDSGKRFGCAFMKRKLGITDFITRATNEYLEEQKIQKRSRFQNAKEALQTTPLTGSPVTPMRFFDEMSFDKHVLSPSIKMFPYPKTTHKDLLEKAMHLPLPPNFPHMHTNSKAKLLELLGQRKTVFYYDKQESNFIIRVYSGPVEADEIENFDQFRMLDSHTFKTPFKQHNNVKEDIWRIWMGGKYPEEPLFNPKSTTIGAQGYDVYSYNGTSLRLKQKRPKHLGLSDYLAQGSFYPLGESVSVPAGNWDDWTELKLESKRCKRITRSLNKNKEEVYEKVQDFYEEYLAQIKLKKEVRSKSTGTFSKRQALEDVRGTFLKTKFNLSAKNDSSPLGKAIKKVDNDFKLLIASLALLFPQIQSKNIGLCNDQSDIYHYLSHYKGEEFFLNHWLDNQLAFVNEFELQIREKIKDEPMLLLNELKKVCDLIGTALSKNSSEEIPGFSVSHQVKLNKPKLPEKAKEPERHVEELRVKNSANRHVHVQCLGKFIRKDNRKSILASILCFKNDWNPLVRKAVYDQLSKHGKSKDHLVIKALFRGLKDSFPPAQLSAVRALIKLGFHDNVKVMQVLWQLTQFPMPSINKEAQRLALQNSLL